MGTAPKPTHYAERSASFIGALGLLGRVLDRAGAFGQILLIAAVFGSTTRADLYFVASIVPLAIGGIVGEAMSWAILPRAAQQTTPDAAERLFAAGFWLSTAALAGLTALYVAVIAVVVPIAVPAGTGSLLPWLAFAPIGLLFGIGTYCTAPLVYYERYVWPALRGAAATVAAFLLTLLVVSLGGGVVWVGLAVSSGYAIAALLLLAELRSIGRQATLALPTLVSVRRAVALWPKVGASIASGVIGGQGLVLIERVLTAPLGVGAVASISYARGVAFTPAVVGQAIAGAVYPSMLRAHAARAFDFVRERFVAGLRLLLFMTFCCAGFLALYSPEITSLLFDRGPVSAASLAAVEDSLLAFSLALLGWMLTIYSGRLFAALDFFRGLVVQELVALIVFVATAFPLREVAGVPGVALAFGIGQVAGGLAAVGLIGWRLRVSPRSVAFAAVAPAVGRAVPVIIALAVVHVVLADGLDASRLGVTAAGVLTLATIATGVLWVSQWPELESLRSFVRRFRPPRPRAH